MNKKTDVRTNANRRAKRDASQPADENQPTSPSTSPEKPAKPPRGRVILSATPSLSLPDSDAGSDPEKSGEARRRRVLMLGLRGVPDIQGGVEKHVEMLAQELVLRGWDVEVLGRRKYLPANPITAWRGIKITPFWAPSSMRLEAFVHTFLGVLYAAVKRPDIVHLHAIGPGLFAPFARLLGLRVVVTHHGYDYDREKWDAFGKAVLRLGERLAVRHSNAAIAVSKEVTGTMDKRHRRAVTHIPNGVTVRPAVMASGLLEQFGLHRRRYIVMVARFVPEKRQTDLIEAYSRLVGTDWKLVLVGGADHRDNGYGAKIEAAATGVDGVVLTGFQSGDNLATLFSQAGLFVLPSAHEGMPIALLEALGYGLPVLASDIVANHEVDLLPEDYFPVGDIPALTQALDRKIRQPFEAERALGRIRDIERNYAWPSISRDTIMVYRAAMNGKKGR